MTNERESCQWPVSAFLVGRPCAAEREGTPLPDQILFLTAGLDLSRYLEIQKRWPVLTEDERQQVVRRVTPTRDMPLSELLK